MLSVSSPQELEESHPGPSVVSDTLRYASPAHIKSIRHPPNLLYFPTPVQKHNPVTLFADAAPSFVVHPHAGPGLNPWPRLSAGLSGARQTPPLGRGDPSGSSPGLRTHADGSMQGSFRLWQRLCETARLFCCARSDCFFM